MPKVDVTFVLSSGSGSGNYTVTLVDNASGLAYSGNGITNPQNFTGQATTGTITLPFTLPTVSVSTTINNIRWEVKDSNIAGCIANTAGMSLVLSCTSGGTCNIASVSVSSITC